MIADSEEAKASALCREQYGSDWEAGPIGEDGSFECREIERATVSRSTEDSEEVYEINIEKVYVNTCCTREGGGFKGAKYYWALFEEILPAIKEKLWECEKKIRYYRQSYKRPKKSDRRKPKTPQDFISEQQANGKIFRLLNKVDSLEEIMDISNRLCPLDERTSYISELPFKEFMEKLSEVVEKARQEMEESGELENSGESVQYEKVLERLKGKLKVNVLRDGVVVDVFDPFEGAGSQGLAGLLMIHLGQRDTRMPTE